MNPRKKSSHERSIRERNKKSVEIRLASNKSTAQFEVLEVAGFSVPTLFCQKSYVYVGGVSRAAPRFPHRKGEDFAETPNSRRKDSHEPDLPPPSLRLFSQMYIRSLREKKWKRGIGEERERKREGVIK